MTIPDATGYTDHKYLWSELNDEVALPKIQYWERLGGRLLGVYQDDVGDWYGWFHFTD
ncbi:hypothetical protein SEA_GILSON_10 [Streptomyces phage Gilson]|jgi:hypothetical protein|uniref:Uncharacterized protein n=1 Tax=Streptomyces phage Gilson TaxID=2488789 RepID=A0A3Q9R4P4_9CAUD|nr:hypothetical protein HWB98_gp010 [Streptomyces phage Gilson]AZU97092.1 hypothetical protein SEA_GILSON_10 [Streptomyces phage Gilson]